MLVSIVFFSFFNFFFSFLAGWENMATEQSTLRPLVALDAKTQARQAVKAGVFRVYWLLESVSDEVF